MEALTTRHRLLIKREGFLHIKVKNKDVLRALNIEEASTVEEFKVIEVEEEETLTIVTAKLVSELYIREFSKVTTFIILLEDKDLFLYHDLSKKWSRADIKEVFNESEGSDPEVKIDERRMNNRTIKQENEENEEGEDMDTTRKDSTLYNSVIDDDGIRFASSSTPTRETEEDQTQAGSAELGKLSSISKLMTLINPDALINLPKNKLEEVLNIINQGEGKKDTVENFPKTMETASALYKSKQDKFEEFLKKKTRGGATVKTDIKGDSNTAEEHLEKEKEIIGEEEMSWVNWVEKEDRIKMIEGTMTESQLLLFEIPDELHKVLVGLIERKAEILKLKKKTTEKVEEAKVLVKPDEGTARIAENLAKEFEHIKDRISLFTTDLRRARRKITTTEMKVLIKRRDTLIKEMDLIIADIEKVKKLSIPKLQVKEDVKKLTSVTLDPITLTGFSQPGLYAYAKETARCVEECGMMNSRTALNLVSQSLKTNNFEVIDRLVQDKNPRNVKELFENVFQQFGKPLFLENILVDKLHFIGTIYPRPTDTSQRDESLSKCLLRDSIFLQYEQSVEYIEENMKNNPQFCLNNGLKTSRFFNALLTTFDNNGLHEIMNHLQEEYNLTIHDKIMYIKKLHRKQLLSLEMLKNDYSCLQRYQSNDVTIRNTVSEPASAGRQKGPKGPSQAVLNYNQKLYKYYLDEEEEEPVLPKLTNGKVNNILDEVIIKIKECGFDESQAKRRALLMSNRHGCKFCINKLQEDKTAVIYPHFLKGERTCAFSDTCPTWITSFNSEMASLVCQTCFKNLDSSNRCISKKPQFCKNVCKQHLKGIDCIKKNCKFLKDLQNNRMKFLIKIYPDIFKNATVKYTSLSQKDTINRQLLTKAKGPVFINERRSTFFIFELNGLLGLIDSGANCVCITKEGLEKVTYTETNRKTMVAGVNAKRQYNVVDILLPWEEDETRGFIQQSALVMQLGENGNSEQTVSKKEIDELYNKYTRSCLQSHKVPLSRKCLPKTTKGKIDIIVGTDLCPLSKVVFEDGGLSIVQTSFYNTQGSEEFTVLAIGGYLTDRHNEGGVARIMSIVQEDCCDDEDIMMTEPTALDNQEASRENEPVRIDSCVNFCSLDRTQSMSNYDRKLTNILLPDQTPSTRCTKCKKCIDCSPFTVEKVKDQQIRIRTAENKVLDDCLQMKLEKDGKYKIFYRLPVDTSKLNWSGNNFESAKEEWKRKLLKLSPLAREQIKEEFDSMVQMGFIKKVSELPNDLKEKLLDEKTTVHALSPAPAYKASSLSTRARIALNAGKLRNGVSLNSSMPTGRLELSIYKTVRMFRRHKYYLLGDIRKFYCGVHLHEDSYKYMLIFFNTDPQTEPDLFVITRNIFGVANAGYVAHAALMMIKEETLKQCSHNKEMNTECVHDYFKSFLETAYVDDLSITMPSSLFIEPLKALTRSALEKHNFTIKDFLSSNQKDSDLLDGDTMNFAGYKFWPRHDCLQVKAPSIHNGRLHRGLLVPSGNDESLREIKITSKDISAVEIYELRSSRKITLQFLVSKTNGQFDPVGFVAPISGSLRAILSEIHRDCKGNYSTVVKEDQYMLWLDQYIQYLKATTNQYPRFISADPETISKNVDLILFADASQAMVVVAYLIFSTGSEFIPLFWFGESKISPPLPIAYLEFAVLCEAVSKADTLLEELGGSVQNCFICSDSTVAIGWAFEEKPQTKTRWLSKRISTLQETVKERNISIKFIKGAQNVADIGTRFKTPSVSKNKVILEEEVGPNSLWIKGPKFLTLGVQDMVNQGFLIEPAVALNKKIDQAKPPPDD